MKFLKNLFRNREAAKCCDGTCCKDSSCCEGDCGKAGGCCASDCCKPAPDATCCGR